MPDQTRSAMLHRIETALIAVALTSSAALVGHHFQAFALPGCGLRSGCDSVAHGPWGNLPRIDWPVSFVGLAYFSALFATWLRSGGAPALAVRWIVRAGAAASLLFLAVMAADRTFCAYCTICHAANLTFWALSERRRAGVSPRGFLSGLLTFAAISLLLAVARSRDSAARHRSAEAQLAESVSKIVHHASASRTADLIPFSTQPAASRPVAPPFTGRYHLGPARAAIRLVVISDYQCPDCRRIDSEIREIMATRSDVSLSAKHFPFCKDCNSMVPGSMHPNACWAARAAETAGMLGGDVGFWKMHRWLFDRAGSFTDAELHAALPTLGFPTDEFIRVMSSDEPLRRVRADVAEAKSLGLFFTPMIFINGMELKGWNAEHAVTRAVAAVAARHPAPAGPESDHPPTAIERYLADWREQPVRVIPPGSSSWTLGPGNSRVKVTLFGDYQEPRTIRTDRELRALARLGRLNYTYRQFPFNHDCNAMVPDQRFALSCRASAAAVAAGLAGGDRTFGAMHAWLMDHTAFDDAGLEKAVGDAGMQIAQFQELFRGPQTQAVIASDVQAAQQLGLTGIPLIFINGKQVPRWELDGRSLLAQMVAEAAGQ